MYFPVLRAALVACTALIAVEAARYDARMLQSTRAQSCGGPQVQELINENRFCDIMGEPSNTVVLEPCCQSEESDAQSVTTSTCRSAETEVPYCTLENDPPCQTPGPADQMLLNLEITTAPGSERCCISCSCKGDPFCTSFSGEKNIEVTCDGRRDDTCKMGRHACHLSRDRAGNKCQWLKDKEFAGQWSSFDEDGSPCQSNYNVSGYPKMTMYQFNRFKVELTTAERGVIRDVAITTGTTIYTLNSERCFEEGASPAAWTITRANGVTSVATSLPSGWEGGPPTLSTGSLASEEPGGVAEWPWRITMDNGVILDMVCTRPLNRVKMSRIDVLSLIELFTDRANVDGYCVDNEIPRGGSTWERALMLHEKCTEANLPDLLGTCKALTGAACRPTTLKEHASDWCDRANLLATEVAGDLVLCKDLIVPKSSDSRAKSSARSTAWTRLVCQLNREPDIQDCISLVSQFGWAAYLSTHSNGLPSSAGGNFDTCVDDVIKYGKNTAGTCAQGVSVQFFDEDADEWTESFFVPANKPPCGGQLRILGSEYPELFVNRIRVTQCDLDAECIVENDCQPVVGFATSLTFSTDTCNLERPDCFNCASSLPPSSQRPQVCVVEPTRPTPAGQCITCCTVDDILFPDIFGGLLCRDVPMQGQPYCNVNNPIFGGLCTAQTLQAGGTALELYLERDSAQISCCATCSTYGDPLGVAFDGTRDKYILCDGRKSNCGMSSSTCRGQRDQKGRRCEWNATLAATPQRDIHVFGSPCQPEDYDDATVLMYDIAGVFSVSAQLGERAILTETTITIPEGTYVLDALTCFGGGEAAGWTWTPTPLAGGDGVDSFFVLSEPITETSGEVTQLVTHMATGIMMRIKCIQSTLDSGEVGGERIDVQALVDTNETRVALIEAGDPSFTGFCPTGKMSEKTKQNSNAKRCQQQNVNDAVRMCSVLADPSCRTKEIAEEARAWCTRAALPYGPDICFDHIWDDISKPLQNLNKVADAWTREYCTTVVSLRRPGETISNFIELCVSEVELEGIDSAVAKWGDGTDLQSYCAVDYTAYKPRASSDDSINCVTGMSLQTQNPVTLVWDELFFMPDNFPPCSLPLVIPATAQTLHLFTRRVRVHQCDLQQNDCPLLGNEDTHCLSNQGFELSYRYTHGDGLCPVS